MSDKPGYFELPLRQSAERLQQSRSRAAHVGSGHRLTLLSCKQDEFVEAQRASLLTWEYGGEGS